MVQVKNFYQIIEELLEFDGYELLFGGEGKLVGRKDDELLSLIIAGEDVKEMDLLHLDESEGKRVLVFFGELCSEFKEQIPDDVDLWDRKTLVDKIGEMVLEKSIFEGATEGESGLRGPDLELKESQLDRESTLKPIMDFDDVTELGDKMVKGFRYRLELVPHYIFHYKVKNLEGGKESGKLYLNAISGKKYFWEKDFERVSDIRRSHFKLEPKVSKENARESALKGVQNHFERDAKESWQENGATIVEKKKAIPSEEDITIDDIGIVFVPMWAVEGTEGVLIINAALGKIEREPDHDGSVVYEKD